MKKRKNKKEVNQVHLLIDGSNMAYRAYYANPTLRSLTGENISVIYGMLSMIKSLMSKYDTNLITVCWDAGRFLRSNIYPEYKQGRTEKNPGDRIKIGNQIAVLQVALQYLGVKQAQIKGEECDDTIYALCQRLQGKILIVSADKDFDQVLNDRVSIYNPRLEKIITLDNVAEEKGYEAYNCVAYLAMVGDDSDNIKGYPGIGEVKAKKLLDTHGSMRGILRHLRNNPTEKGPKYETLKELWAKNQLLICLKTAYVKGFGERPQVIYLGPDKFKPQSYISWAQKYGLREFIEPQFINLFKPSKNPYEKSNSCSRE